MTKVPETLQALVRQLAQRDHADAICALSRDSVRSVGHRALGRQALDIAHGLHTGGVKRGEPVVLFAANSPEWMAACLGVLAAGGVVTPIDTQMPLEELSHALRDSGARRVFTDADGARRLDACDAAASLQRLRLDTDGAFRQWLNGSDAHDALPAVEPGDDATLFYTSGTTGPPKGVPLTHANLTSNLQALVDRGLAQPTDRIFIPLPWHHVYPFSLGLLAPVVLGGCVVLPYSVLGPQIVRALRDGEATVILGVPRLYEALDAAIQGRLAERGARAQAIFGCLMRFARWTRARFGHQAGSRVSRTLFAGLHRRMAPRLRMVVSGGAPLDPEIGGRLQALGWEVATGYGLTETSPILTYNPPDRVRLDAAGLVLPGVDLRIQPLESRGDPEDDEPSAPKGLEGVTFGEVQARGPNVFRGYRNLPEKTEKAFTSDGFYRTGDLGWIDTDGYLYLSGRASEMIVLAGGENIDPERVERALIEDPVIRDAGVLDAGGDLVAVLQPDPEAIRGLNEAALHRTLRAALVARCGALPSHHRVEQYRASVDPLPRTRLGKMRRHQLRALYEKLPASGAGVDVTPGPIPEESMSQEDQQLLQIPTVRRVWETLGQRYTRIRLTPDSSLHLDLGVDSLGWLDLTLELRERAGVAVDEDAIARIATVRELLREAAESEEVDGVGESLIEQLRRPDALLNEQQQQWLAPRSRVERALGHALLGADRGVMAVLFRLQVRGGARVPRETPILFAPNHQSVLDPPALAAALARIHGKDFLQRIAWGGWTGMMFQGWLSRRVSRASRVLPVDPRSGPRASLALGAAALAHGEGLVWFPEGSRSEGGTLQTFLPGVGLLALAHQVPVVPVWIEGTGRAMPPGRRVPRPTGLSVTFGEAVLPDVLVQEGGGETPQERLARALQARVAALGEQAAHPGGVD